MITSCFRERSFVANPILPQLSGRVGTGFNSSGFLGAVLGREPVGPRGREPDEPPGREPDERLGREPLGREPDEPRSEAGLEASFGFSILKS